MSSIVTKLIKHGLFNPPESFVGETVYEVIMGSMAYGVAKNNSDVDVYAVCVPSKDIVFPYASDNIVGFGPPPPNFEVYQKHHMELHDIEYDANVYSIIKFFNLCAENNPNMIDSLFVPTRCIVYKNDVGDHFWTNRRLFLSKRIFDKMRGYAFSELKRVKNNTGVANEKRAALVEKFGYNTKSAYHVVRLMLEAEMVLEEGDLDLERHREQLKFVREGGYTLPELEEWFKNKEMTLAVSHANSTMPITADYGLLKSLLLECLEMHYGTLDNPIFDHVASDVMLDKIRAILK